MNRSDQSAVLVLSGALLFAAGAARGQSPTASGSARALGEVNPSASASVHVPAPAPTSVDSGSVYSSCVEHLPEGATRPKLTEKFPTQGLAGYALPLELLIEHGAGESVLPQGFSIQNQGVEADALQKSGFMIPSSKGEAPPELAPMSLNGGASTRVIIHVVALPKTAGRHEMILPPLPVAVARASGEMMTLCTRAHQVVIDDPTANTPEAKPRPNPLARRQLEHWDALERGVQFGLVALVAAVVGALAYRWWRRRPKPIPPPPPPRPAWEIAQEALAQLRASTLLQEGHRTEFVDVISDILRRYLGARYGFDGLEATSREIRKALRSISPPPPALSEIERLLDDSDLIKFARVSPTIEECDELFTLGETIVRETIPSQMIGEESVPPTPESRESP